MSAIKWLPGAKDDLRRLHEFILPYNAEFADRAVSTIITQIGHLEKFPEAGRLWEPDLNYREYLIQFCAKGYIVRYRLVGNDVIIVRIWHGLEER